MNKNNLIPKLFIYRGLTIPACMYITYTPYNFVLFIDGA